MKETNKVVKIENIMGLSNNAYKEIVARKQVLDIKDVKDPLSLLISTFWLRVDYFVYDFSP